MDETRNYNERGKPVSERQPHVLFLFALFFSFVVSDSKYLGMNI